MLEDKATSTFSLRAGKNRKFMKNKFVYEHCFTIEKYTNTFRTYL